jgi:hypothetical protein
LLGDCKRRIRFTCAESFGFVCGNWTDRRSHALPLMSYLLLGWSVAGSRLGRPTDRGSVTGSGNRLIHDWDMALVVYIIDTPVDRRFSWVEIVFDFTTAALLFLVLDFINSFLDSCEEHHVISQSEVNFDWGVLNSGWS